MDKLSYPEGASAGDKLTQKVRAATHAYSMLEAGESVLVALSGGADSVALLLCLRAFGYAVSACHLNHGLRGAEADRDETFCRSLCARLDVPLVTQRVDAAAHAKQMRESIETAARDLRYTFFVQAARETGAVKIATAHTASDNLETVLFHVTRGTGLDGLCGIPPVRGDVVRPLITCTRMEVEDYLLARGQNFVTDSTNFSGDYTRNRIRREVIPVLEALNPKATQAAADLSARLRGDAAFLRQQAEALLEDAAREDGWDVQALRQAHAAMRTRALRHLCAQEGVPVRDFTARHVAALEGLLAGENPSARVSLPGGLAALREYDRLRIAADVTPIAPVRIRIPVHIPFSGTLGAGFSWVTIRRVEKDQLFYKSINTFYVDCDTIDVPTLVLCTRHAGDRLRLGSGSKTLKKLLIDRKIPRSRRDSLTVLADRHGLIAVQDVGIDVSRNPKGGDIVEIQFEGYNDMRTDIKQILFTEQQIAEKVSELGARITADFGGKNPLVVSVLKGSYVFMADLTRKIDTSCNVDFMVVSSYGQAAKTSGEVQIIKDIGQKIEGRDVIIVEDILDSGLTLSYLMKVLKARGANSISLCTLLSKPERHRVEVPIDYLGFEIPDEFVVGYGLDYAEKYRNLPYIGILAPEVYGG